MPPSEELANIALCGDDYDPFSRYTSRPKLTFCRDLQVVIDFLNHGNSQNIPISVNLSNKDDAEDIRLNEYSQEGEKFAMFRHFYGRHNIIGAPELLWDFSMILVDDQLNLNIYASCTLSCISANPLISFNSEDNSFTITHGDNLGYFGRFHFNMGDLNPCLVSIFGS